MVSYRQGWDSHNTEIVKPGRVIATHISPDEKNGVQQYQLAGIKTDFLPQLVR